jgi:hypothetical protein
LPVLAYPEKYSPEQIRVKGIEQFGQFVSHETIYA